MLNSNTDTDAPIPTNSAPTAADKPDDVIHRAETILENIGEMFFAVDAEWRFIYVNRLTEKVWKMERGDLLGRKIIEVFPQIAGTEAYKSLEAAMEDRKIVRYETVSPILGIWVESTAYPSDDGGISCYFRDIDERKRSEQALVQAAEALRASDERYRKLLDSALEGIMFLDADANITYVNYRMARMLRYDSVDELIGRDVYYLFFPEEEWRARDRWAARLVGVQEEYELRLRGKDGYACWTIAHVTVESSTSGDFQGTFTMFTDITERRRAQMELAHKNEEVEAIFERVTDAVIALDNELRYTYVNPEAERLYGRSRGELVGQLLVEAFPETRETVVYSECARALRDQVTVEFELYYGPLTGWFEVRAYPSPTGLSIYFRNVTEQKEAEIERERNRQERERSANEKANLLGELQEASVRQRRFLREMLYSLTEGRLSLCDLASDLPAHLPESCEPVGLTRASLRQLRLQVEDIAGKINLPLEREQDFLTAVGEAGMNAVVHAGGGDGQVFFQPSEGRMQVWIYDKGRGIAEDAIHRATLEKGFSSAGTLGHGFWMMLKTADRIYLLTGPEGTTVVLETEREPAKPAWLQTFGI